MRRTVAAALVLMAALATTACATSSSDIDRLLPADALLLGEQHDVAAHHLRHRDTVSLLAARDRLAALALEMAEQGRSTAGFPATADEAAVREALRWNEGGWPWQAYGPAIMAAVRAGVPVLGANLPRTRMREAMRDEALEGLLTAQGVAAQRQAIRDGHCGLLTESQVPGMARIQIARDRAMAQTVARAVRPGQTVVLLAGSAHVDRDLGVPRHLPPGLRVRSLQWPIAPADAPTQDYCAQLRQQLKPAAPTR